MISSKLVGLSHALGPIVRAEPHRRPAGGTTLPRKKAATRM